VLHSLGLLLVRQKRLPEALPLFEEAAALSPEVARYAYVYALALHSAGQTDRALSVLGAAEANHPGNRELAALRKQLESPGAGGP
jgi:thioredoxin-like negative regulator of GroEL